MKTLTKRTFVLFILCLTLVFLISGCVRRPAVPTNLKTVPYGKVATKGIVIEEINDEFSLKSGERFIPPFQILINYWVKEKLIDQYEHALRSGARKVRVTVPGKKQKLYGVLALNGVATSATGPAARSYLIQVPDKYVQEADGGAVSVIYEPLGKENKYILKAGWILWISDMPIGSQQTSSSTGIYVNDGNQKGMPIVNVRPNSPAAKAEIETGDILVKINNRPVANRYKSGTSRYWKKDVNTLQILKKNGELRDLTLKKFSYTY